MIDIVIGAGFGDEGKGQTVSNIIESRISEPNYVVRFNGGHQAGHTVEYNGMRHIFSNFGAGTLQGIPTYWSKYCTIHPKAIKAEYEVLKKLGIDPILHIDPLSLITLPHDIVMNQQCDKYINKQSLDHGTVGVGFGQTIQRNEDHFKLFAQDLLNEDVLKIKLKNIEQYYYGGMDVNLSEFIDECGWLVNGDHNITIERPDMLNNSIFEGAQGILLDEEYGFFPYVTRSKTTAKNAFEIIKEHGIRDMVNVNYVSRSYSTRHGNGQFPQEKYSKYLNLKDDILETNINNEFQGEFRRSILDIDILRYAINLAELDIYNKFYTKSIIFTCTDHHKDDIVHVVINGEVMEINKKELEGLTF